MQTKVCTLFSACQKSRGLFCTLQIRHIFCENKFSRKISLCSSKSLIAQAFLMAIIQLEAGLFSLRLGHGAALTCHRHVIHSRAAASLPLKLPRCAVIFPQQHRFFDRLRRECRQKSALSSMYTLYTFLYLPSYILFLSDALYDGSQEKLCNARILGNMLFAVKI